MDTVRILEYDEQHVDAYAMVIYINEAAEEVCVSNMNMPYQGTLSHDIFKFDQVEFL